MPLPHSVVAAQADGHEAAADLGGAVITGVDGNPLAALARQLGIPMYKIDAEPKDCPLFQSTGKAVPRALDKQVCTPALLPRHTTLPPAPLWLCSPPVQSPTLPGRGRRSA